jgi:hypothetical protein
MTADYVPEIRDAAYRALRNGGLLNDDPGLVGLFALDSIKVRNGCPIVPPDFVKAARAAKPDLFGKSALEMTSQEVFAAIDKIAGDNARVRVAAESKAFLDGLKKKYAAQ